MATNHKDLKEQIEYLARILAGEMVLHSYAAAGADQRFVGIETSLSTLEKAE
jgi:hypothetical protein